LEMLARNSLETTGELDSDSKQGAGKMKELASLVLKGTGLSSLQKPTSFTTLDFLGEQTQFYWDVLYRRCPQKIRVEKGLERCVKGLFLAELSPRLLLRDFWQQQDQSESGLSYALIYSSGTGEGRAVESLFPWTLQDSFATAQALRNLGSRGVPQVYKDRDSLCMLTALKGVRQAHLTACLKEGI